MSARGQDERDEAPRGAPGAAASAPSAAPDERLPRLVPPPDPTHSYLRRATMFVSGLVLFVVGTVLWLTPVVTGAVPFWVAGLVLMGAAHRRIGQLVNRAERRLPLRLRKLLRWRPGGSRSRGSTEGGERP